MDQWLDAMDDHQIHPETTKENLNIQFMELLFRTQIFGAEFVISSPLRCLKQSSKTSVFLSLHVKRLAKNLACSSG
jgi:hypothetical protein